jgi:hypothetical protein
VLLNEIPTVQQELLSLSNQAPTVTVSPEQSEYWGALATAWHSDYRVVNRRPEEDGYQTLVTNPSRPICPHLATGGSLASAESNLAARELLTRLTQPLPDLYPTGAQLRTLQRRVKAWRAERAGQLLLYVNSALLFPDRHKDHSTTQPPRDRLVPSRGHAPPPNRTALKFISHRVQFGPEPETGTPRDRRRVQYG